MLKHGPNTAYAEMGRKPPTKKPEEPKKVREDRRKVEVEGLITKGVRYVSEEYVPERLKKKDWLD